MSLPRISILILAMALAVTACGKRDKDVRLARIKNTTPGPDEFSILPGKPLEAPESYAALPTPVPGGANLTDQNPKADGIAALGGNANAVNNTGIAASDAGLVRHSGRYGVSAGIRQTLAVEDEETRKRHGLVNILRLGKTDDYTDAYRRQWLDSQAEQERLRRRGIETPTAPPAQ